MGGRVTTSRGGAPPLPTTTGADGISRVAQHLLRGLVAFDACQARVAGEQVVLEGHQCWLIQVPGHVLQDHLVVRVASTGAHRKLGGWESGNVTAGVDRTPP